MTAETAPEPAAPAREEPAVAGGEQAGPDSAASGGPGDSATDSRSTLVAQILGNASVLTAALVYMGWVYEDALLEHFQVSPFSLNIGVLEFALKSLPFFFRPVIILGAVVLVMVAVFLGPALKRLVPAGYEAVNRITRTHPAVACTLLIPVLLAWFGLQQNPLGTWFARNSYVFYVVVALVGIGPLLLTWPSKDRPRGHFAFPLALVVATLCTLWIAGLYADRLGTEAADSFASTLPSQTAVVLYSVQSLDLSGPGVVCTPIEGESFFHERCTGLALLYAESGTYYLLPVNWTPQNGRTYVVDDTDQIRVELSAG
jgi:hypothetical protein